MEHKLFVITIVGPESSGKTTLASQLASHFGCPWVPEYAREYLEGLGRTYTAEDLTAIAEGQLKDIDSAMKGQSAVGSPQLAASSWQTLVSNWQSAVGSPQSKVGRLESADMGLNQIKDEFDQKRLMNSPLIFDRESFGQERRPVVIVDSGMLSLRMWARIKYGITIPLVEEALKEDVTSMYILCRPQKAWEPDPLREAPLLLDRAWIYNQYLLELVTNLRQ